MNAHPDLAGAALCDICGAPPSANRDFCRTCRAFDRKVAAAQRQSVPAAEERRTPQVTIEAIMFGVRARGLAALKEPDNLERLRRCDQRARAEINERIDRLLQQRIIKG
jgi:hypothetical protein